MLKIFLIFNLLTLITIRPFAQNCTYPESPKTGIITYARLPAAAAPFNFRFFYRMTIDCGMQSVLDDLAISDPMNPKGFKLETPWIWDSSKDVTGVIDPCLVFPSSPCRSTYYYHADAALPDNPFGLLAASMNCCRPNNAVNLYIAGGGNSNSSESLAAVGGPPCPGCNACAGTMSNGIASYIKVPPLSIINNSAQITSSDTILSICQNRPFSYQVQATDPDGDSIAYHFSAPRSFTIYVYQYQYFVQKAIPFPPIPFNPGYSAAYPAGMTVSLDPVSGIVAGSIPDTGVYDLTISALEYRNNVLLDSVMLDLYVSVFDCALLPKPKASIPSSMDNCNSYTVFFPNNSSPLYPVNFNTTFQWDFGDGSSSQLITPTHTYADTGTYQTRLIVFPGLYCADTAFTKVLVYPFVQASFTHNDSCLGQPILFTSTSTSTGGAITSTRWNIFVDSTELDSSGAASITYRFSKAPQTYSVLLTVGTDKGCQSIDTQYVNIWPAPLPLTSHDTILSYGTTLQLQANDGNYNYNGQFLWSPPEGLNNPTIPDPVVTNDKEITYYIAMENSYGCSLLDSIHIKYYTGPAIYVPNAFTPNGDGRNDILRPLVVGFTSFNYFRVFNRSGQIMFETGQPGQGWDGTINGRPAPAGAYIWEAAGVDYDKKFIVRKGTAILIR